VNSPEDYVEAAIHNYLRTTDMTWEQAARQVFLDAEKIEGLNPDILRAARQAAGK